VPARERQRESCNGMRRTATRCRRCCEARFMPVHMPMAAVAIDAVSRLDGAVPIAWLLTRRFCSRAACLH
jgi:hypothetical protein